MMHALLALLLLATTAHATSYRVGAFAGATDQIDCGNVSAGKPACATLAYWTQNRRSALTTGDIVELHGTLGPTSSAYHCIAVTAGVTYRGVDSVGAATPKSKTHAVIDLASTPIGPSAPPCNGSWLGGCGGAGCNFNGFRVENLTIKNAAGDTGSCGWLKPVGCTGAGGKCTGLTLDTVRVSGCRNDGFGPLIGDWVDCVGAACPRTTTNVTISDSEFDNSLGDGLLLGDIDGLTIERTTFHDIGNRWCDPAINSACPTQDFTCNPDCEDDDGVAMMSVINGTLRDVGGWHVRQEPFDFSRHNAGTGKACPGSTYNNVLERWYAYDNGNAHVSVNSCAHDVTIRNGIGWGTATAALDQYQCGHHLSVHNNTIYAGTGFALKTFQNCKGCDFRNNILRCNRSGGSSACVFLDLATTAAIAQGSTPTLPLAAGALWRHNLVKSSGGAPAIGEYLGACTSSTNCASWCNETGYTVGTCSGNGQSCCANADCPAPQTCTGASCQPAHPGFSPGWGVAQGTVELADTAGSTFASANAAGGWFGANEGQSDLWGTLPTFVATPPSTPADFHLASGANAIDAGESLAAFFTGDYDTATGRTGSWDIGADEFGMPSGSSTTTSTPATTTTTIPVAKASGVVLSGGRW